MCVSCYVVVHMRAQLFVCMCAHMCRYVLVCALFVCVNMRVLCLCVVMCLRVCVFMHVYVRM